MACADEVAGVVAGEVASEVADQVADEVAGEVASQACADEVADDQLVPMDGSTQWFKDPVVDPVAQGVDQQVAVPRPERIIIGTKKAFANNYAYECEKIDNVDGETIYVCDKGSDWARDGEVF